MKSTAVAVVGAGPAGLALSASLTAAAVDHVVFDRDGVASAWRHRRWDSLRTLTPNWMNGLPGLPYLGPDPDGFMRATEVYQQLDRYASTIDAPVVTANVTAIGTQGQGFALDGDMGRWRADAVVLATGPGRPDLPPIASALPPRLVQVAADRYRNPGDLGGERILVVGASASGVQLADELVRHGRHVTLAVGEHVRLPRHYRGRDILWWMQAMGVHSRRWDEDPADLARARRVPSPQLIGTADRRHLDLRTLRGEGVELVGRLAGVDGGKLQFAGSLANLVANADLKQVRLLDQIDEFVAKTATAAPPGDRPAPTEVGTPPTSVPVEAFDTVLWATGHRFAPPQLDEIHLDRRGRLLHDGGRLRTPGLFVIGLPFLRRRSSTFLTGIGRDAIELSGELLRHLDQVAAA